MVNCLLSRVLVVAPAMAGEDPYVAVPVKDKTPHILLEPKVYPVLHDESIPAFQHPKKAGPSAAPRALKFATLQGKGQSFPLPAITVR